MRRNGLATPPSRSFALKRPAARALAADKNALRTQLKVNMLRIRERELLYYTNNCLSISTSAVSPLCGALPSPARAKTAMLLPSWQALLAGFAKLREGERRREMLEKENGEHLGSVIKEALHA